ncbi:glutamic acid-rich protein isoform X5 [Anoplophora glabripennis]|uniref:glutamic acid-rich protein isoform X5 n=1 Tax=Anoplophora glabripennis TaxID=217634 RepID=UPI000874CDDA|nr:glutamic acid-rich protein isoform X5 [Anoplophora glabripennis]
MVFTKAMPAGKESDSGNSSNAAQRTTFRPPWVKEGPNPLPTPAAPWTLNKTNRKDSNTDSAAEYNPLASVQLRKTKIEAKEPQENGSKESFFKKPALKPVPQREKTPPKKDHKIHNLPQLQKVSERVLKNRPSVVKDDSYSSSEEEEEVDDIDIDREVPTKRNALVREASMRRLSQSNIPAPPPQPGMPPPPPTMPGELPKKLLNDTQKAKLDKLRSRPKNRPDWNNLLQEIESKKKLKHVVCNDRSQPLLPEAKAPDEHFLYKSEEPNVHNELLKQIEGGIKLKRVKTNDRSKPNLDGLRKFRRQMTIEEQIQKSMSMASIPPVSVEEIADEIDEMDDIDKVRDDLQSTKQMLALELRNKEAQERENKRLLARLQNLEAELEKEKSKNKEAGNSGGGNNAADEKIIKSLKTEVEGARKTSQDLEKKYTQAAEELDSTKSQLEEMRKQNQLLEKRLQEAGQGKRLSLSDRKHSTAKEESDEDLEDEETAEESDGEDTEEKREKRAQKELKTLTKKLQSFKNKEDNARKERIALREIIKKHQTAIKEEKKRYKQLKKEVDKMEALMKDMDEEEEEDEEEKEPEDEESEEEEEESSEEESESESDESDSERSQSEDEDAPVEKKKTNITARVKRHENILNALKKGNFLLKTNAERLQDDLNKQKELTASLQEDLDSVLSELG